MIINACRLDKQIMNKYLQIIVTILLIKVNMDIGNVLNATKIEEVKSLLTPYWHLAASLHSMKPFHSLINLFKLKQWIFYSSALLGHISILHILKASCLGISWQNISWIKDDKQLTIYIVIWIHHSIRQTTGQVAYDSTEATAD